MRPYLAIIKDSFRAAIASRVLYVLLLLISLLLLAIAPFRLQERVNWAVIDRDIFDVRRNELATALEPFRRVDEKIVEAARRDKPSPRKLIWEKLSPEVQTDLEKLYDVIHETRATTESVAPHGLDEPATPEQVTESASAPVGEKQEVFGPFQLLGIVNNFLADINRVIETEDLYDEAVWNKDRLDPEIQELLDQGNLTDQQTYRLNRLLVSEAFSPELAKGSPTSLEFSYAFWDIAALPLRRQQVKASMGSWMPWLLDKGVLAIGVFVAILVTAPIIPQTFDPGALSLLLSKPVGRTMLLLSKFVGGCAFVSICAIYLFVGMWSIFGIRLGIWNSAILISIPVYILVFAIYYSVSTAAGMIWRNTVICVVFAILFWLVCFSVGSLNSFFDSGLSVQQMALVVEEDSHIFADDQFGMTYHWNESTNAWDLVMVEDQMQPAIGAMYVMAFMVDSSQGLPKPLGPVYLSEYDQLVLGQSPFPPQPFVTERKLVASNADSDWSPEEITDLPRYTVQLLTEPNGNMLAVTADGNLYRLKADPLQTAAALRKPRSGEAPQAEEAGTNIFSALLGKKKDDYFQEVTIAPPFKIGPNPTPAMNVSTGQVALLSRNLITFVEPDGVGYKGVEGQQIELSDIDPISTLIAFGGSNLVAARGNGEILLYDVDSNTLIQTFTPDLTSACRGISASSDGHWFAITLKNGDFWILDARRQTVEKAAVRGQGDVSFASFSRQDKLWVGDRTNRLTKYSIDGFNVENRLSPPLGVVNFAYRYIIHPLYVICPKPGEFYKLIDHLTTAEVKDKDNEQSQSAVGIQEQTTNPWSPLWTGLAFMAITLVCACIYFERQEF